MGHLHAQIRVCRLNFAAARPTGNPGFPGTPQADQVRTLVKPMPPVLEGGEPGNGAFTCPDSGMPS